jgi:hypothetical protein
MLPGRAHHADLLAERIKPRRHQSLAEFTNPGALLRLHFGQGASRLLLRPTFGSFDHDTHDFRKSIATHYTCAPAHAADVSIHHDDS